VADPLRIAVEVSRPLLDVSTLTAAIAQWNAPWRVAVVGRISTGKSTLVNLLTGRETRPTGLGGVTDEIAVERAGEVEVLDTPGIDDESRALAVLQPLLETVDVVIWVIDGLQPLTATERRVFDACLVDGTPLHILVSRLDLTEEAEVDSVLQRVRTLTARHAPLTVRRADLRHCQEPPVGLLDRVRSPRRHRALLDALDALTAALEALPEAPDLPQIRARIRGQWASTVRRAAEDIEATIDSGDIDHKEQAVRALSKISSAAVRSFEEQLSLDPAVTDHLRVHGPPPMPVPSVRARSPLRYVLAGMSGAEGAQRALKVAAAQWMADGEIALNEWIDAGADLNAEYSRRHRVLDAIDCAKQHAEG